METRYKDCQSCGVPLSRDDRKGGTNADGTRSRVYCSRCFVYGRFTTPDITLEGIGPG